MIKVIMPMRRREGMTIDEFREYYGEDAQEKWDNSEIAPFDVFRKKE